MKRAVWRRKVRVEKWLEVDGEGTADRSAALKNVTAFAGDRDVGGSRGDEPPPLWTPLGVYAPRLPIGLMAPLQWHI